MTLSTIVDTALSEVPSKEEELSLEQKQLQAMRRFILYLHVAGVFLWTYFVRTMWVVGIPFAIRRGVA
jgi:hypothetical protein